MRAHLALRAGRLALLVTCGAAGTAVGAAEPVSAQWTPDGRFAHQATIAPKQSLEVCDMIASGARVDWKFSSDAELDFNVHFHEGAVADHPVKLNATRSGSAIFVSKKTADYCWMWSNRGAEPASIALALKRPGGESK